MSKQLRLSAAISTLVTALFVLSATPNALNAHAAAPAPIATTR